jgi:hypothetical protein
MGQNLNEKILIIVRRIQLAMPWLRESQDVLSCTLE